MAAGSFQGRGLRDVDVEPREAPANGLQFPTTLFTYLLRHFVGWYLAAFAVIVAIMFLGDVVELLRRAAGVPNVTFGTVLDMALLKLPSSAEEVAPFAVLLGTILALWRLSRSQELVVARAAGLSVWQFLTPAIVIAFLGGVIAVIAFNPLASSLEAIYQQLDKELLKHQPESVTLNGSGLWLRQSDGRGDQLVIHSSGLYQHETRLDQVTMLFFDSGDALIRRIDAARATLQSGAWRVDDAVEWTPSAARGRSLPVLGVPTALTPDKIEQSFAAPETLSFWTLPGFIDLLERSGFSAQRHRLYFDSLLARPFLLCAMVLVAAVFSLRLQRRGGVAHMLVGGVAAGFLLYFLQDVVFALGLSSTIPVVLAAWTPAGVSMLLGATFLLHLEDG